MPHTTGWILRLALIGSLSFSAISRCDAGEDVSPQLAEFLKLGQLSDAEKYTRPSLPPTRSMTRRGSRSAWSKFSPRLNISVRSSTSTGR